MSTKRNDTSNTALRRVTIDTSKAELRENLRYRGNGMVSANNTSRLLIDYKAVNPAAYEQLLQLLFGEKGLGINHLKLEMGSDINSSSGTEACVKRSPEEKADVTRGAGFVLAHDAREINPGITLDMLFWSEPRWVTDAADPYDARYRWYKETLDAAYETYGLKFDYVSATRNERAWDDEWIKYLSRRLKAEKDCPYDYSAIGIVTGEEVCTWKGADDMIADRELADAVDVIGSHYTSWSTDNAKSLAGQGKDLWLREGSAPAEYAQGAYRYDGGQGGLNALNGMLDVANRFLTMYHGGRMCLYEYQPAIAAYYSGATYTQKQLILADEPWSGHYTLDSGFYMGLHFSRFYKRGWAFIDNACYGDGKPGGDGHCIVDARYTYMTACDPDTNDYSFTVTNTTDKPITYSFTVRAEEKSASPVYVWETRGPDSGAYDENYFKKTAVLTPVKKRSGYGYTVEIKPYSLVTLTTLDVEGDTFTCPYESKILPLPYSDDFGYDEEFITSRGGAPLYTCDGGGAFEIVRREGGNVLMQKITADSKADEWGWTPDPVTDFGDDRWADYGVTADVSLAPSDSPDTNYAGICARYNLADIGDSGYRLALYESGRWQVSLNGAPMGTGELKDFSPERNTLCLGVYRAGVKCFINGKCVYRREGAPTEHTGGAGRAALCSSLNTNSFGSVRIVPIGDEPYVMRFDDTDECFSYEGDWQHDLMCSFRNYHRTLSAGGEGCSVTLAFAGTGFALIGENRDTADVGVVVDDMPEICMTTSPAAPRERVLSLYDLADGEHTVTVTVKKGTLSIDAAEIRYITSLAGAVEWEDMEEDSPKEEDVPDADEEDTHPVRRKRILPIIIAGAGALLIAGIAFTAAVLKKRKKK